MATLERGSVMKKYLNISLFAFIFAANLNCYAAGKDRVEQVNLVNAKEIQDATAMENAFINHITEKSKCLKNKLTPPSSCRNLPEFSQAKAAYRNTVIQHPGWQNKILHWNTPKDHYLHFNSLKISFQ